ncbi:hypothetical protein Tco_0986379 [Tanacetum coccineum]
MNEDYYHEQNSFYDPSSFGFDQFKPPKYTVNHPIFNAQNELLNSQNKLMEQMTSIYDMVGQYLQKKGKEKKSQIAEEQSRLKVRILEDSFLCRGLVQTPSESEDSSECKCDLPPYDDSSKNHDLTFSNPLFDINEDFTSSDESFSKEDIPNENFKIFLFLSLLLMKKSTSTKDYFDYRFSKGSILFLIESPVNSSLHSIPSENDDVNLDLEGDILFLESLLYDNSSPQPSESIDE